MPRDACHEGPEELLLALPVLLVIPSHRLLARKALGDEPLNVRGVFAIGPLDIYPIQSHGSSYSKLMLPTLVPSGRSFTASHSWSVISQYTSMSETSMFSRESSPPRKRGIL